MTTKRKTTLGFAFKVWGAWSLLMLGLGIGIGILSGCATGEPGRTDLRAASCSVVNSGGHYRYNVETDTFEVARIVADEFAKDAAAALSCGASLGEDWGLEPAPGAAWPDYLHFDEGDWLVAVNGERDPSAMLAEVEETAANGGILEVTYQRGDLEAGHFEHVDYIAWEPAR